jgi:hypothetical protein
MSEAKCVYIIEATYKDSGTIERVSQNDDTRAVRVHHRHRC